MFENIKKLKEIKRRAKSLTPCEKDVDGRNIIKMRVDDDSGFLSPYSLGDSPIISVEVAEFFDNNVKPLDLKQDLHIVISGNTIDESETCRYENAIKNYYSHRIAETERKLKNNSVISLIMTVIAVLILAVFVVLELFYKGFILLELIDIAAWVFAWEAVDLFFIERKLIKYDQILSCKLYDAVITFENIP